MSSLGLSCTANELIATEITANYEVLFLDLFENIDKDHEWNPNIELGKRITWLGDQSDIAYHAMSDFWILKGRDMLAARIWRKLGDSIMMAGRSVEYSLAPLVVNKIRSITFYPHVPISGSGLKKAETSLASGRFSMVQNRPDKCLVEYLICCDLKGWIPKPLTDAVMGKLLLSDAANLRKRAQQTASTQ
uniref:START domain-containing protein n=1 Tax=Plectus sambesii TaxID=2011161 RepID=A0A914VWW9_9BILA